MGLGLQMQSRLCRRLFLFLLVVLISISLSPLADFGFAATTSTSIPVSDLVPGVGDENNEVKLADAATEHERRSLMLTTYMDYSQAAANNGHNPGNGAAFGRTTSARKIPNKP